MRKTNLFVAGLAAASIAAGCGFDPQIWGGATSSDFDDPPAAGVHTVSGASSALGAGATVSFFTGAGAALAEQGTTTAAGGAFSAEFPASEAFNSVVVAVSSGPVAYWGVVPQIPKKATVQDASLSIVLGTDSPGAGDRVPFMSDLGVDSTLGVLLLMATANLATPPSTLSSLSPDALISTLTEVEDLLATDDPDIKAVRDMLTRLLADGAASAPPLKPFAKPGVSFLTIGALAAGTDYTGDGVADTDTVAFDEALEKAATALAFDICFSPDMIRVVLMTDFNDGGVDRVCAPINKWKWTLDEAGKQMFITGALHESTRSCDSVGPPCLEPAVFDAASQKMGNWTPNITPMFDDGTHGDAVAGDNIWTITFDLPWWDAGAPDAEWVRISYKYTWGNQGALWTGSEEWPGNQRILELRDVNGDHIITRLDTYGDETTNKNAANLLPPNKGGCGTVLWASDLEQAIADGRKPTCANDTVENQVDIDSDCVLDEYPAPGTATPITVPCPE